MYMPNQVVESHDHLACSCQGLYLVRSTENSVQPNQRGSWLPGICRSVTVAMYAQRYSEIAARGLERISARRNLP